MDRVSLYLGENKQAGITTDKRIEKLLRKQMMQIW
jgi:hypothetical protein